ncbi:pimeloyl-ACP methyl ester carboxylesterase/uncharacterized membrane protein, partial [Streptosporangium becharense]|nr:pimeloyl-ACP methyl ester carboxylesterase/uncharacterized membrane protein [Streptosporangium becharense]
MRGLSFGDFPLSWLFSRASARRIAIPALVAVLGSLALPASAIAAPTPPPSPSPSPKIAEEPDGLKLTHLGALNTSDGHLGKINSKGQVAGYVQNPETGKANAVLFSAGSTVNIHAALGNPDRGSQAVEVNDDGTVIGRVASQGGVPYADTFVYKDGKTTRLGLLYGSGINNRGQITGYEWIRDPDGSILNLAAFAGQDIEAYSLNESGEVVGMADMDPEKDVDKFRAFRTEPGKPLNPIKDRLNFVGETIATDVNDNGQVAGAGTDANDVHRPLIWDEGGDATVMKTPADRGGTVNAINNAGVGVGMMKAADDAPRAALYQNGQGIDLTDLVRAAGYDVTLRHATGINDRGQIAVVGRWGKQTTWDHAFLLDLGVRPVIGSLTIETQRYPSTEWNPVPDGAGSTVEGNKVRVVAQVTNPSDFLMQAEVGLVDDITGRSLISGRQVVELEPHKTVTVREEWDTNGWAWERGPKPQSDRTVSAKLYHGGRLVDSAIEPIVVLPKPVVAVHGWRSDAEDSWGTYNEMMKRLGHPQGHVWAVGDDQAEGRMDTGEPWNPLDETYSIRQNADELAIYVEDVRKKTGAFHVNMVAHSMGGLIARQYIQTQMPMTTGVRPAVSRLIGLGIPNGGSPCADRIVEEAITKELTPWYPSVIELTTDYLDGDDEQPRSGFNDRITNLKHVLASNLVGTDLPVICTSEKYPLPSLGDGVVPWWSALNLLLTPGWDDHHPLPYAWHSSMTSSENVFKEYVLPRLAYSVPFSNGTNGELTATGEKGTAPTGAAAPTDEGAEQNVSLSTFDGPTATVEPGQTAKVPLQVPQGLAFGVTGVLLPETVGLALRDPSGKVTTSYAAGSDAAKQLFQGLSVTGQQAGAWTLEITNTAAQAVKADLAAWVTGNPVKVAAKAEVAQDGRVTVTATVTDDGQPVTGVPVKAWLVGIESKPDRVAMTLNDDGNSGDGAAGDGVYGARTEALPGDRYYVVVKTETAKGLRTDRELVAKPDTREFELTLSAGPGGSVSASPAQEKYRA